MVADKGSIMQILESLSRLAENGQSSEIKSLNVNVNRRGDIRITTVRRSTRWISMEEQVGNVEENKQW